MPSEPNTPSPNLTVSWRLLAVSSLAVAIALAAALAVVAHKNASDYLATVALSLAIISFLIQVVVFIFQTNSSSNQLLRAEELNAATIAALAKIEEKTEGTAPR